MDCILYSSIYRGPLIINKVDHILSILYYFSVIYVSLKHVISTSPNPSYKTKNPKKIVFVNSATVNSTTVNSAAVNSTAVNSTDIACSTD